MVGVLSLGASEGQSFRECPLKEPWHCFLSKAPECNFVASGKAVEPIEVAVRKAGLEVRGAGTFGAELIGVRINGKNFGHLDAYNCEVTAYQVRSMRQVPSLPPPP